MQDQLWFLRKCHERTKNIMSLEAAQKPHTVLIILEGAWSSKQGLLPSGFCASKPLTW